MNEYLIEHEIPVLLRNSKANSDGSASYDFIIDEIKFEQLNLWLPNSSKEMDWYKWLAKSNIKAATYMDAISLYLIKLNEIVPKIALIWQAYINQRNWSLLIQKEWVWVMYYRFEWEPSSLTFGKKEQDILDYLHLQKNVPPVFYEYWYDVINTYWYSAKILLMCAAIESLLEPKKKAGKGLSDEEKKKRIAHRETILWKELSNELFANSGEWLRHRLTHGEYLSEEDLYGNYIKAIHEKIIEYFNSQYISIEQKINTGIENPQRHPYGNIKSSGFFLKPKSSDTLSLVKSASRYRAQ